MNNMKEVFDRDGVIRIPNAIPSDLIETANEQINAFRTKNDDILSKNNLLVDNMLQRVINLHFSVSSLNEIFLNSMKSGSEICDIYGRATLHTSLFFELGSQQPLHRDTPYFYSGTSGGYMGVWVALDDADEENGALMAVKGSHKVSEPGLEELKYRYHPDGKVPPSSTELFNAYNESVLQLAQNAGLKTEVLRVNKGDMIIWNPSTLHGGLAHNNKKRSRRSFVMHITPKNMPMKHMDYFFDRSKPIEPISKAYTEIGDRLITAGNLVDFRHMKTFSADELGKF